MKTAQDYINEHEPNSEFMFYYHASQIKQMINKARIDVLSEACNVVKTYKISNTGSWYDAAVDRTPIIELIKKCQCEQCNHDFEPYYNWCNELAGYRCEKCGEEKD